MAYEQQANPHSGYSRYMIRLRVPNYEETHDELNRSDSSLTPTRGSLSIVEKDVTQCQEIKEKIRNVLTLLNFRKEHVLVQFWSPLVVENQNQLTVVDQPFGINSKDEETLLSYRGHSKSNPLQVDDDHEDKNSGPPARVYRKQIPEWTCDINNYMPRDFPLQQYAIDSSLFGYLALPVMEVIDSTTKCVGVLEVLTSSGYPSFAYEVKEIHTALKEANRLTKSLLCSHTSNVHGEVSQNEFGKIKDVLKRMCDEHGLPLAQTWGVSPFSSYVSHEKVVKKSCSSFNTKCIGKVCMSTTSLPQHVKDINLWKFQEACSEQHLEMSCGFVGMAVSNGSCFCEDVTILSVEEYPLVHHARMYPLTSCFAILLRNVEGDGQDYVLKFFLPLDAKDNKHVPNMVKTLKQNIECSLAGFEVGNVSSIEVAEPRSEVDKLYLLVDQI